MEINSKTLKAIQNLRDGFRCSIINTSTIFLFFLSFMLVPFFPNILFVWLIVPFVVLESFIWGLAERIRAWKILQMKQVEYALIIGSVLLVFFVFTSIFNSIIWMGGFVPFHIRSMIFFLSALTVWGIYTFIEAKGLRQIEEKFHIPLSYSRKLSLLGIAFFSIGIALSCLTHTRGSFLFIPLAPLCYPVLFAFPFLIGSCAFSIKKIDHFLKGK